MKKCKYCGKEFESTPVYCVRCGASDDFLIRKTDKVTSKYSKESKKIENYDDLVKEFLGDEHTKNDKWAIPRDELNQIKKESDDEYYSFLKKKLGNEPLNSRSKDEYYSALEDVLEDPLHSTEETTFNGIFDKEDTIENTFFKSKEKKGRGISNRKMKSQRGKGSRSRKKDDYNVLDDATMEMTARTKKNKKTSKKLWKMIFGLIALLALLLVIMFTLINNIVNVNDVEAPLPTEAVAMSLFSEIKNTDEASFLKSPQGLYISSDMDIMNSTNQAYLKALFDLVNGKDYEIKSVKKIEAKGASRAVVTYEVTGESLSAKVFESLIFIDAGNNNFKLDFEEFILRYNRLNSTSKANNT
ncbi:hypothetical protein AZF37_06600 [endosymbiont 'TC1' of Trimyema compressum]|uniref:hypothetical protein n=1 Tax=endosymbiont 'TC1' of Trimyema compressum TaxID=243899 RepID=UPI0007F0D3D9|nr:hypothetical protein [endosymbiont 'TC1' of Trimyema compressum]AMP20875.1 hypothetical protein AZF37_06600 [endosymbiont 'TC1' of Trimyema compressum]